MTRFWCRRRPPARLSKQRITIALLVPAGLNKVREVTQGEIKEVVDESPLLQQLVAGLFVQNSRSVDRTLFARSWKVCG